MNAIECKRCGGREDELHLFISCPFAQQVWEATPLHPKFHAGTLTDFHSLLTLALRSKALPPTCISLSPLAPWILWNLWKSRNYLIFEDRLFTAQDIVLKSLREAGDWQSAQASLPKQALRASSKAQRPNHPDSYKCFVDAAWCSNTKFCGQGWVVYDPSGNSPRRYSASRQCVLSALTAEALAMRSVLSSLRRESDRSQVKKTGDVFGLSSLNLHYQFKR